MPSVGHCFWPNSAAADRQLWVIAVPKAGSERPRRNVSEAYYDKQQKAAILHDLRTPTRQSGRSAIRQYRWRLLGMHRRYRGGNGMHRVARLRTQRIRGRTSAWLDRSIQALIRKLHYDRFGSFSAGHNRQKTASSGQSNMCSKSQRTGQSLVNS